MPPKKTMAGTPAKKTTKAAEPEKKPVNKAGVTTGRAQTAKPTKTAPPTKALAKVANKAVSTSVEDIMAESAGQGSEMFGIADVKRPTIKLMQGLSPYINKNHEKYVEGAANGDILVTGADHLYEGSINLIVVGFAHNFVEWKPRSTGGGLVGAHPFSPSVIQGLERGKGGIYVNEEGNELHDTMSYFVLYETPDGEWEPAMLFLKSTMLSVGREINTKLSKRTVQTSAGVRKAGIFCNIVTLGVVGDSNAEGDWNKFRLDDIQFIDDRELLNMAKQEYVVFAKSANIDYAASSEHYAAAEVEDEDEGDGGSHY